MPCGQFLPQMTVHLQNLEENRRESQIWGDVQRWKTEKKEVRQKKRKISSVLFKTISPYFVGLHEVDPYVPYIAVK